MAFCRYLQNNFKAYRKRQKTENSPHNTEGVQNENTHTANLQDENTHTANLQELL